MTEVLIREWQPFQLIIEEMGPFRTAPAIFSFLGETAPSDAPTTGDPGPSNLYMLLAPNGSGKTTVLEAFHGLFGLMCNPPSGRFATPLCGGRAQLDIRASMEIEGMRQTILLSIWTGSSEPLHFWEQSDIDTIAQADGWGRLNLVIGSDGVEAAENSNKIGRAYLETMLAARGAEPTHLMGEAQPLPTVLYFPADRLLVAPEAQRFVARPNDWGYAPAYCFGQDGPGWSTTLDNLLVWLEWLADDRLQPLLDRVNEHVFERGSKVILPPRRAELLTYVSTERGAHLLSGLSHGERALLQMYMRVFAYSTAHTVLLIDEIELHLHTRWVHRMFRLLKELLAQDKGLTLIFTTHDRELIKAFDYETSEPGLTKGGFLIDEVY